LPFDRCAPLRLPPGNMRVRRGIRNDLSARPAEVSGFLGSASRATRLDATGLERSGKLEPSEAFSCGVLAALGLPVVRSGRTNSQSLNLLGGFITVDRQIDRLGELVTQICGRQPPIACPAWLVEDFAAVLPFGLSAAQGESLVFVNGQGGPLAYTNWRRRTCSKCREAKLPDLRFHDFAVTECNCACSFWR